MAMSAQATEAVFVPEPDEAGDLRDLAEFLGRVEGEAANARIVGPDGEVAPIPAPVAAALRRVVGAMSEGMTVTLAAHRADLTTTQAAALLHVSRPFLVRNLLGKDIPYEKVGTHRRIQLDDVLAYRERRAGERRSLLDAMTAAAQDVTGGYR